MYNTLEQVFTLLVFFLILSRVPGIY